MTPTQQAHRTAASSAARVTPASISLVAVFTALVVVASIVPGIPVGVLAVPITLQTLAVLLAGLVLGPVRGALSVLLFLVLGFIGLPIFAKGASGIGVLAGPTGGYLVGFVAAAAAAGYGAKVVLRRWAPGRWLAGLIITAVLASVLVVHTFGILGLMLNARLSFPAAFAVDVVFVPGDLIKAALAAGAAAAVHKAFPAILARA